MVTLSSQDATVRLTVSDDSGWVATRDHDDALQVGGRGGWGS